VTGVPKMKKESEKRKTKQPDIRVKQGVFQLSAWKRTKVIPARNDYDVEREVTQISICLSVGQRRDGQWNNVQAWFRSSQFEQLEEAVDEFREQLKGLNGVRDDGSEEGI
jgi:hypothetical protein